LLLPCIQAFDSVQAITFSRKKRWNVGTKRAFARRADNVFSD